MSISKYVWSILPEENDLWLKLSCLYRYLFSLKIDRNKSGDISLIKTIIFNTSKIFLIMLILKNIYIFYLAIEKLKSSPLSCLVIHNELF